MVFSSTVFLFLFLPIVLFFYYNPFFKGRTFRNYFLLLASLGFYAWGEPVFVFLMIFSIFITWLAGGGISVSNNKKQKKIFLIIGIVYHAGILFVFKYLSFVYSQFGLLLNKDRGFALNIALPIGISFFTFQLMSYLFDIYYDNAAAQRNLLYVGLYVSLFPQLIAGPIVRYNQIEGEIENRTESLYEFSRGMERFISGLGKKVLLSNYLAFLADKSFAADERTIVMAWLGAVAYTFQIYFDFSGYSDMAIGLGRMFGFHFSENFNYPYIAKSISDFWKRWHISLSTWFRDYVYIPLGGNRVGKTRWILNIFIVWLLTGVWHGANWTFLCWGLFYFGLLLAEKLTGFANKLGIFSHIYTMLCVVFAWVIFRADTISLGISYIGNMFGIGSIGFSDDIAVKYMKNGLFVLALSAVLSTPAVHVIRRKISRRNANLEEVLRSFFYLFIFGASVVQIVGSTYNPFIYFNF